MKIAPHAVRPMTTKGHMAVHMPTLDALGAGATPPSSPGVGARSACSASARARCSRAWPRRRRAALSGRECQSWGRWVADNPYAPSPLPGPLRRDSQGRTDSTVPANVPTPTRRLSLPPSVPMGVTITPCSASRGDHVQRKRRSECRQSRQGARGPGADMPATFRQYARPGEDINNPADNMAVHNRIIADYASRWPNDPARVAVAYSRDRAMSPHLVRRRRGSATSATSTSVSPNMAPTAGRRWAGRRRSPPPRHHPQHAPARDDDRQCACGRHGSGRQGLSPIQQAQQDVGGEGGQALPPAPAPQLGPGDMHNAQVAAQAPR